MILNDTNRNELQVNRTIDGDTAEGHVTQ